MLQQGVIVPNLRELHSYLRSIKVQEILPVVDFTEVNEVTDANKRALPVLSDLRMSLSLSNINFSSLELLSGYWQVPLAPESRKVTVISSPHGRIEWLLMLFGRKSALITFQGMVNSLFSGTLCKSFFKPT